MQASPRGAGGSETKGKGCRGLEIAYENGLGFLNFFFLAGQCQLVTP